MDSGLKFTKLSELVDDTFTVQKVHGYKFKFWDNDNKRMLVSDTYEKGYRKVYTIDTDKGRLDLGTSQFANLFEAVQKDGTATINDRIFEVKSNGKSGMDIRYFINASREEKLELPSVDNLVDSDISVDDIPF